MRILGVDPGSRQTGFGCVDWQQRKLTYVSCGTLKLSSVHGKSVVPLEDRLVLLFDELSQVIADHRPQVMVIEKVFFANNVTSALKLGHARGVAMLVGKRQGLQLVEYSPTQVKSTVSGYGQADKQQVAKMVQLILGKREFSTFDASDGLALAICHAYLAPKPAVLVAAAAAAAAASAGR